MESSWLVIAGPELCSTDDCPDRDAEQAERPASTIIAVAPRTEALDAMV
jgi:hypothetical protein